MHPGHAYIHEYVKERVRVGQRIDIKLDDLRLTSGHYVISKTQITDVVSVVNTIVCEWY